MESLCQLARALESSQAQTEAMQKGSETYAVSEYKGAKGIKRWSKPTRKNNFIKTKQEVTLKKEYANCGEHHAGTNAQCETRHVPIVES
ncbi:Hypothetical protein FKW44_012494 [Caligus rogercresseyi]|uniref:Uncharacterized protein n=1 Tax=Caligus rogercresseyi TaxID=217165 RepID=A0A7T8HJG0_CALRO|nr:Hypothetical protein FKW44_012494 [Caligus rogercresseyi]